MKSLLPAGEQPTSNHKTIGPMFNGQPRGLHKNQGQNANISGKLLHDSLVAMFKHRGVPTWPYDKQDGDLFADRILRTNVPYQSRFGSCRSDLVYYPGNGFDLRIECRYQQGRGSVDEKFMYFLDNAKLVPEPAVWLVLGGFGARYKAVAWLRDEAHSYAGKIIRVYTEAEARIAVKDLVENGIADTIFRPNLHAHTRNRYLTP